MSYDDDIVLEGKKVGKNFGGLAAVREVNFAIPRATIVGLIGPNGAGKTTLFNTIAGVYRPDHGSILFEGQEISGNPPHIICKRGISRTFQIVRPFLKMTSLENVMVGAMFASKTKVGFREAIEKGKVCLDFVGLADNADTITGNLTLADRKRVELAKALASDPKVVLLDELLAGLNPTEVQQAVKLIRRIRDELKITPFWVEHVMDAVIALAEHIIVLNYGEKIAEGPPQRILDNQKVIDAYLGEEYTF
jgi:branched-chain amino acid transport system ATP-binding protein